MGSNPTPSAIFPRRSAIRVATPKAKPPILLDPGSEVYTARTFSARRYESKALSSWGHAVPLVGGQQQHAGRKAEAKILEHSFTDAEDRFVLDITSPYSQVEGLSSLTRTFIYTRSPKVSLVIVDELVATKPLAFGTALITYDHWNQTGPRTLLFFKDAEALEVVIDSGKAEPVIHADVIDEDMGSHKTPTRVGIRVAGESANAKIVLTIRRVSAG